MQRILISETTQKVGETVKISGWVKIKRDHGKISFVDLLDRTGFLQCVVSHQTENYEEFKKIRPQWVLNLIGEVKKRPEKLVNPDMATGGVELDVKKFEVL